METAVEIVRELWQELLDVDAVELNANFFDSGGNSLLAMLFLGALMDGYSVHLSLRVFFDHPTVAGIAQEMVNHGGLVTCRQISNE